MKLGAKKVPSGRQGLGLEMGSDVLEAAVGAPVPELLASHTPSSWSSCFQKDEVSSFRFWCEGFPCGSAGKESACNAGDLGSIPGSGKSPGEGKGYPLQYSGLENSMDYTVLGVAKSWTRLSNFHFHMSIESVMPSNVTVLCSSSKNGKHQTCACRC